MKKHIPVDEQKRIINFFFYMQDCICEIASAHSLLKSVEDIENNRYAKVAKTMFMVTALNVCRLSESILQNQGIIKYFQNTKEYLNNFRKTFYTKDLIHYRNKYLVHPMDTDYNTFIDIKNIIEKTCRILNTTSPYKIERNDIINYISLFYDGNKESDNITNKILIDVKEDIRLYFNLSESEFIEFFNRYNGLYETP